MSSRGDINLASFSNILFSSLNGHHQSSSPLPRPHPTASQANDHRSLITMRFTTLISLLLAATATTILATQEMKRSEHSGMLVPRCCVVCHPPSISLTRDEVELMVCSAMLIPAPTTTMLVLMGWVIELLSLTFVCG